MKHTSKMKKFIMKFHLAAGFLIAATLLSSCSNKTRIEGEVLIEEGGKSIKATQVDIQIVTEEQLAKHIRSKSAEAAATVANEEKQLQTQIQEKEALIAKLHSDSKALSEILRRFDNESNKHQIRLSNMKMELANLFMARRAGVITASEESALQLEALEIKEKLLKLRYNSTIAIQEIVSKSSLPITKAVASQVQDLYQSFNGAKIFIAASDAALESLQEQVKSLKAAQTQLAIGKKLAFFYNTKIDNALSTTATDSEGKFQTTIEGTGKLALLAYKSNLTWMIWLPSPNMAQKIFLSNKNTVDSGCAECIFNDKVRPQNF